MSTLLVTGGGGFVMSHVARQWIEAGRDNRTIVLDAAPLDDDARSFLDSERIVALQGDVTDSATWETIPEAQSITHMVHGAAVTSVQRHVDTAGIAGALPALNANIMGVAEAIAFAARLPALKRFINVSSGSVYADDGRQAPNQPLPEDGAVHADGWYALSKLSGELITTQAAASGLPALSVRLSGVYGPMDRTTPARAVDCIPRQLVHAARDSRMLRLAGLDGGGDFLHAGDVASAILALLACDIPRHPVYNIAYGAFTTLRELADMVPGLHWEEASPELADIAADPAFTTGRWGAYDISRLIADTGWRPRSLTEAIADYSDWLTVHRN